MATSLIADNYIQEKLNPIIKPLIVDIIKEKPSDIPSYILNWINTHYPPAIKEPSSNSQSDDDDDIDDDEIKELEVKSKKANAKPRTSISAEPYGEWNKKEKFIPKIYEKSEEQIAKIKGLLKLFMFTDLSESDLLVVIRAMQLKSFEANDNVIKEGEEGNCLYIVDDGKLECSKKDKGFLRHYVHGDLFGELALLYNVKRQASIKALTKVDLWVLDRETFVNVVKDSAIKQREKYESILKNVEMLKGLSDYDILQLGDALKKKKYTKSQYIIKQGTEGKEFYILVSGQAVAVKGNKVVMEYKPYDYFGELALLNNQARAASIACVTNCEVLSLDRDSFNRLLGPLQSIMEKNASKYN